MEEEKESSEDKVEDKNEFDNLDADEFPAQTPKEVPGQPENLIAGGTPGQVYDYRNAPEGTKAPPRIDMNGKVVTINKAEIIIPPLDKPWEKTKKGDKEYKYCTFVLHYDFEGQREFMSGVRVFKKDGKYSHPTMTRDRKNQSSRLLGVYADFKKKDINEVSLKEFLSFLNSKPKVEISSEDVMNPTTEKTIQKNFVGKFISE